MTVLRQANLFFQEGNSDKVYHLGLVQTDAGYTMEVAYGRRGKPLKTESKDLGASVDAAEKIFTKQLNAKLAKGYQPSDAGVAVSMRAPEGGQTGFRPQLLNEITWEEARSLGDDWLVQVKHDGERRGLLWADGEARFANRRGLETSVREEIASAFARLAATVGEPLELDAEDMGDHVVVFDVLRHGLMTEGTFRERAALLSQLEKTVCDMGLQRHLNFDIPTPAGEFFSKGYDGLLQSGGAEGFVLRQADSLYTPGRPASGGTALKVKFWAEATFRVTAGREGKSSVGLEVQDGLDGPWVFVGNVTVPPNQRMPEPGDLVEVRYLYAHDGGSVFQPVLKGLRNDLTQEAAQMAQLKFKTEPRISEPDDASPGL